MFDWLARLRRRPANEHEPEIQAAQREQRRKFDAWESTMTEVERVQRVAQKSHAAMHRPRRQAR